MDLTVTSAKLTGDVNKDVKTLANHVFQLEENLRYALRNLDVTNFNDLGLARYENGRLQVYSEVVEVQAKKLRLEFGKETDEIYAQISATAEELLSEISKIDGNYGTLESQIRQTANEVSAIVSSVGAGGEVTAASIVAAINADGNSQVKISANKVDISGVVTFSDLSKSAGDGNQTIIDGSIIRSGRIESVDFVATGDMYGTGTVRGFLVNDNANRSIGRVGYGWAGPGYNTDQMFLNTYGYWLGNEYYTPKVKVYGVGGVSIETGYDPTRSIGGPVFVKSDGGYISFDGSQIFFYTRNLNGSTTVWSFQEGGLFKNGEQVL